jgi:hypothetical protein
LAHILSCFLSFASASLSAACSSDHRSDGAAGDGALQPLPDKQQPASATAANNKAMHFDIIRESVLG